MKSQKGMSLVSDFDDLEVLFKRQRMAFDEVGTGGVAMERNCFSVAPLRNDSRFENTSQSVEDHNL